MDDDTQKLIEERIAELPEDIQQALASSDLESRLHSIGQTHKLHIDQVGHLQDLTMLVLLGFADPESYEHDLADLLKLPSEGAQALAADVGEQVFMPLRESMKSFMERRATPREAPEPRPAAAEAPLRPADAMLSAKVVSRPSSVPPPAQPLPPSYKVDPYREPPE